MKYKVFSIILLIMFLCVLSFTTLSSTSFTDWKAMETDNVIVYYPPEREWQAREVIINVEKYLSDIIRTTGNKEAAKTIIIIEDPGYYSNGYANSIECRVAIFTTNPGTFSEIGFYQNWLRNVTVHEMTHIYQMSNVSGIPGILQNVFGNYFLPNQLSPGWIIEGITVYNESQNSNYEGRLNAGYYDAILAAKIKAGKFPSILEATYGSNDYFPMGYSYVYGGLFFQYLAQEYGEEKLAQYFNEQGANINFGIGTFIPGMGIDNSARLVFGKGFPELFKDWQEYEEKSYSDWEIDGRKVVQASSGTISSLTADNSKIYYFKTDRYAPSPGSSYLLNSLLEYDPITKTELTIDRFTAPVGRIEVSNGYLYYTVKEVRGGYNNIYQNGQGLVSVLYRYNLANNTKNNATDNEAGDNNSEANNHEEIFIDGFRDFAIDGNRIIYIKDRSDQYGSEIWQYKDGQSSKLAETGEFISEILNNKGNVYIVSKGENSSWDINKLIFRKPGVSIRPLISSPYAEKNIYIKDTSLYYSSNYNGHQTIYRYNLKDGSSYSMTQGDYAVNPVAVGGDIFFKSVAAEGEAIYTCKEEGIKVVMPGDKENKSKQLSGNDREDYQLHTSQDKTTMDKEYKDIADRIQVLEKGKAFKRELSNLLRPNVRFIPDLVAGNDALGLNYYRIYYGLEGPGFNLQNSYFQPLNIDYNFEHIEGEWVNTISLSYPLTNSSRKGHPDINLGYYTDFSDSKISVEAELNYPCHNISVLYSRDLNSGSMERLNYMYLFSDGNVRLDIMNLDDYSYRENVRPYLDGIIDYKKGSFISGEYTKRLMKIRKGSWNPNFYYEDLYATIFIDYYDFTLDRTIYGCEFSLNSNVAYNIPLETNIGFTYRDKDISPYFSINLGF